MNKLTVKFENELGEDYSGVSREFFSEFWLKFLKRNFYVNNQYLPLMTPHNLYAEHVFVAAGRILIHGYILLDYLPFSLNTALMYYIFQAENHRMRLLKSAFRKLSVQVKRSYYHYKKSEFSGEDRIRLASWFGNNELQFLKLWRQACYH